MPHVPNTPLIARSRAYAQHVFQKVAGLTVGALYVSEFGRAWRRSRTAGAARATWPGARVAIVAHIYYPDILNEVLACRDLLPEGTPLFLTVPPDRVGAVKTLVAEHADIFIHKQENRGRDIAPFLGLLSTGVLDRYDAVLKLHTKRSPHLMDGEIRRKLLFDRLCGDWNAVCRTVACFNDASIGMVGWGQCWRSAPPYWMADEPRVRMVAERMQAPAPMIRLGFFEGTMFWFRPAAFEALRELSLKPDDFEPEAHQLDGTLHHALERCFTIAAWARGFSVRDLKGRAL